jgi:hypothetical protein
MLRALRPGITGGDLQITARLHSSSRKALFASDPNALLVGAVQLSSWKLMNCTPRPGLFDVI